MKTKQIVAIIVAVALVLVTGVIGVASNILTSNLEQEEEKSVMQFASLSDSLYYSLPEEEFIGVLDIVGEITPSAENIWGYTEPGTYNHELYMSYVDELMYSDYNKGIMLYIDSPGGTVYESDEMYVKLMEYKEETGRPIWAYFASEACSGGYYIAMAADEIYANRNCWTGSIGVIVSLLNCKELYDNLGIKEIDITSGANKAMGSSALDLTEEQYGILQSLVDEAYDQFVGIVKDGRKMEEAKVRELADGRIYSAKQALEANLIDAVGSYEECQVAFEEKAKLSENIIYHVPEDLTNNFFGGLFAKISQLKPKSEVELATDIIENNGNGVLKYYAK